MTWGELLISTEMLQSPALPTELSRVYITDSSELSGVLKMYLHPYFSHEFLRVVSYSVFIFQNRIVFCRLFLMWNRIVFCALFLMATPVKVHLRRGNRLVYLEVVAVEVALEVEVRERVLRSDTEERLELRVRLDRVLVLEVLLLDVRRDRLRHV